MGATVAITGFRGGAEVAPRHDVIYRRGDRREFIVGSSVAIAEAGPAVLLAYLFAGLLVVMIMRMLAEMAVATAGYWLLFHLRR
ncbi:gamma-aminobutyrate transporter [Klebsiella pneumoniae]|uniref:Gamma-aminobutyrate transporter n=1 Tax=Klebsiella pneumoniae TaxID=573 RepID=A0A4P0XVD1_KLEPN|nr:gamma-aminobutyrate transporter [Klebsiella pneumoniae]